MYFKNLGKILCVFLFIAVISDVAGQNTRFTSVDSLQKDLAEWTQKSSSPTIDSALSSFINAWDLNSSNQLKEKAFKVIQSLFKEKYWLDPTWEDFLLCYSGALENTGLDNNKLIRFLEVADTAVMFYKPQITSNFFGVASLLINSSKLHSSKYNELVLESGVFEFDHKPDFENIPESKRKFINTIKEKVINSDSIESNALLVEEGLENSTTYDDSWGIGDDLNDNGWGEVWVDDIKDNDDDEVFLIDANSSINTFNRSAFLAEGTTEEYVPSFAPTPDPKGPLIDFTVSNLSLETDFDTLKIEQVTGYYLPTNDRFVGNGGRVYWTKEDSIQKRLFCELPNFMFSVKDVEIDAHYAELHSSKIDKKVIGYFRYKLTKNNKQQFPEFKSYRHDYKVDGAIENVDYLGGYSMIGNTFSGYSLGNGESMVTIKSKDTVRVIAKSNQGFLFSDTTVSSPLSSLKIYYGNDSISIAGTKMKYFSSENRLEARKNTKLFDEASYKSDYHNVYVHTDFIEWDLDSDSIHFYILNARDKIPLKITSYDYYHPFEFNRLKVLFNFHPITLLAQYAKEKKDDIFSLKELAESKEIDYNMLQGVIVSLSRKNFIDYNSKTDKVHIREKLKVWDRASQRFNFKNNKQDFDNMRLSSRIDSLPNATLSTNDKIISVRGVNNLFVSDSLNVVVKPEGEVLIGKNRNMEFGGTMIAGKYVFRGKNFLFDYDSFKVSMPEIDSMSFLVPDSTRNGELVEVSNNIVNTSGILMLSKGSNKSGLEEDPKYPILINNEGGSIKFNKSNILGGAYDETISFDIPPFVADSINSDITGAINFKGIFRSGGIFPEFEENIVVQDDNSFGFDRETPNEGYPVYKNKGNFKGKLSLSNKGLRGDGSISFLTGNFLSKDFIYYPDSVVGIGKKGEIKSGIINEVAYPNVQIAEGYSFKWVVENDEIQLKNSESNPFLIYNENLSFSGLLSLKTSGISGAGEMETTLSSIKSPHFDFNYDNYYSDNAEFKIKSDNPNIPAVLGKGVSVKYDLTNKQGVIRNETAKRNSFLFPYSKFITNMNQIDWDVDKKELSMFAEEKLGFFQSTYDDKPQIAFLGKRANYDLDQLILRVKEVPFVRVANVNILPYEGKLTIKEGGEIDPLENASVELNAITKFHKIVDANITIHSGQYFEGNGYYNYVNDILETTKIEIEKFKILTLEENKENPLLNVFESRAYSVIEEENPLAIDNGLEFSGNTKLVGKDKNMHFRGKARLRETLNNSFWFEFNKSGEDSIKSIEINQQLRSYEDNLNLHTGIYLNDPTKSIFSLFMSHKVEIKTSTPLMEANGYLSYDNIEKKYSIKPKKVLADIYYKGNQLHYYPETNATTAFGEYNLISNKEGDPVNLRVVGKADYSNFRFGIDSTILLLDFSSDKKLMNELLFTLASEEVIGTDLPSSNEVLKKSVIQLLSDKDALKVLNLAIPAYEVFKNGILLSETKLLWSDEAVAFYSEGKVHLTSVFGNEGDVKINAHIEIPKSENNYEAKIFLFEDDDNWVFFSFQKNYIGCLTSNPDFNASLGKGKGDLKPTDGTEVVAFVNRYRLKYYTELPEFELNFTPLESEYPVDGGGLDDSIIEEDLYDDKGEKKEEEKDNDETLLEDEIIEDKDKSDDEEKDNKEEGDEDGFDDGF